MIYNIQGHHAVAAAVTTIGVIGGAYYAYRAYHRSRIPTEWLQVGTLSILYAYPIKSCAPVLKDQLECSIMGVKDGWLRDRMLMVTDENYHFVTARQRPELFTIHPTFKGPVLTLEHDLMEPIHVNLAQIASNEKPKTGTVWGCEVPVFDCGDQVSEWLNKILNKVGTTYRLAYYASTKNRPLVQSQATVYTRWTKDDTGVLHDQVPFNLINDASVDDLNKRLEEKISHRNFRPNFVLKGAQPYDEDTWNFVKIGDNVFEIIKPCTRCIMTTVDPETGARNPKQEPLETLKSYRLITTPRERKAVGSIPRMGLNLALRSGPGGIVSLGDPIYVA